MSETMVEESTYPAAHNGLKAKTVMYERISYLTVQTHDWKKHQNKLSGEVNNMRHSIWDSEFSC